MSYCATRANTPGWYFEPGGPYYQPESQFKTDLIDVLSLVVPHISVSQDPTQPNFKTLQHAAKMAMDQDKPIRMDYYNDTRDQKAFLGECEITKDKMLVRNAEDYTSLIQRIFKISDDFIVITENSIYIINGSTKKKTISLP